MRPVLRFTDAELNGFDKLMTGAGTGDDRETTVTVSREAEAVELRGEKVQLRFRILDVKRWRKPELTKELLTRVGVDSEEYAPRGDPREPRTPRHVRAAAGRPGAGAGENHRERDLGPSGAACAPAGRKRAASDRPGNAAVRLHHPRDSGPGKQAAAKRRHVHPAGPQGAFHSRQDRREGIDRGCFPRTSKPRFAGWPCSGARARVGSARGSRSRE